MTLEEVELHNKRVVWGALLNRPAKGMSTPHPEPSEPATASQEAGRGVKSDDPESALHDYILEYCRDRGWLPIHSRLDRPTTVAVGVSDFVILTPKTVYFVEAKRPGKKPTPKQQAFLMAVKVLGWPAAVVHSKDEFDQFMAGRQ